MWMGVKAFWVTYVVMEGLGLAGVLARLPPVWSRTIQIPEHAVEGSEGRWVAERSKGQRTEQQEQMYNSYS